MARRRASHHVQNSARVIRQTLAGMGTGLVTGGLCVWLTGPMSPLRRYMTLAAFAVGFGLLSFLYAESLRRFPGWWKEVEDELARRPPDPTGWFGKVVSFGFGSILGLFAAVAVISGLPGFGNPVINKAVFVACILGGGFLTMRFGDEFWRGGRD